MVNGMDALRSALLAADPDCIGPVTAPQLAAMLGVSSESQMQLIRRNLLELTRRGELEKLCQGKWKRTGKEPARRGVGYQRMWRAIRSASGVFTAQEVVMLSRVEQTSVYKYLRHLEDEGLVQRAGRKGNTVIYRITVAGREHQKTPYPPLDIADPYQEERAATAALCRILLLENVNRERVRQNIRKHLEILTRRFAEVGEGETHAEQEN